MTFRWVQKFFLLVTLFVSLLNFTQAATVTWNTNMHATGAGPWLWSNASFWSPSAPAAGDTVFMTNALFATGRVITNDVPSINLADFTMSWAAGAANLRAPPTPNFTNYFVVTGTTIIGNNATFSLQPTSSGGYFMTNNNLYLIGNAHLNLGGEARGQTVVVTGNFSNSPNSQIYTFNRNDGRLIFTQNAAVTNRGTMTFFATGADSGAFPQISVGGGANDLVNLGTITNGFTAAASTQTRAALTLISGLVNHGTIWSSNNASPRVSMRVIGRTDSAVTNFGTWNVIGVTSNASVVIEQGGFVNHGALRSTLSGSTNLFILSGSNALAAAVFSNAPAGEVFVSNGNLAIRATRIINAGTNTISNTGTLLFQTTAGAPHVFENAGIFQVNGTAVAGTVTNRAGGQITGTGTITADVFGQAGSTWTPGPGIGIQSVNGNVTFENGATFQVELSLVDSTSDRLNINGGLTLAPNSILTLSGGIVGNVYTVAQFTANSLIGTFGTVTPNYLVTYDNPNGYIFVSLQLIPEPSTLLLLASGLGLVAGQWRRMKRSASKRQPSASVDSGQEFRAPSGGPTQKSGSD